MLFNSDLLKFQRIYFKKMFFVKFNYVMKNVLEMWILKHIWIELGQVRKITYFI